MSRKRDRIYYKDEGNGTVLASRIDSHGVEHYGRGSSRSEAAARLRRAEKSKNVAMSTAQPQPAAL